MDKEKKSTYIHHAITADGNLRIYDALTPYNVSLSKLDWPTIQKYIDRGLDQFGFV